jgi:hypothetical protein
MDHESDNFDQAADQVIALGNRLLEADEEADPWELAEGLLAGAIHFWLYSRQPCDDPLCENCADVSTAELRIRKLIEQTRQHAEDSNYYETPHDSNVGTA